ncbi:hypothetical protein ASG12_17265 [Williamsia sp. Leaf354]|uniref:hypothetical protein n=1 Tax=Williamsia sp. Leaf354 TaxID=1736349 RepID=UPI0006FFB341|nr:hypothetical protein [Williamsia sp. Leaf354]KQR95997.1 hypothetical protein ASG12_17265 [Williamsia sp. Leaf354]
MSRTPAERRPDTGPPTAVRRAGVVVALEGIVAVVIAVVLAVHGATGADESFISSYGTAGWFAILGSGVVAGGVALFTGRRWGRAIAVVAQILLIPVAFALLTDSGQPWLGAPLLVVVVIVLGLLFSPKSVRWLADDYAPDAEPPKD